MSKTQNSTEPTSPETSTSADTLRHARAVVFAALIIAAAAAPRQSTTRCKRPFRSSTR